MGHYTEKFYLMEYDVEFVGVEVFTKNIIFVRTKKFVINLKKSKVDYFLKSFSLKETFKSTTVENILEDGINNKSLDIDFMAKVLDIKQPALNGVFNVESIGYNLYFENGYLAGFETSTGLTTWGKYFQSDNPQLIDTYEKQASLYWGKDPGRITKEVNVQADALANTPNGMLNEYLDLHRTRHGLVNFHMLLVCHYNWPITLTEFISINHGRYANLDPVMDGVASYSLGYFQYDFDIENEELLLCYQI